VTAGLADTAEAVLLWVGVGVLVVAAVGAGLAPRVRDRIHYVSLAAMAGLPLVVVSQCIATPAQAPKLLVVGALILAGAPALTAATGRAVGGTGQSVLEDS
jgi:uncharacterized membrane protein YoaK (UPF0700 family)